jgi:hypothetical protein
MLQKMGFKQGMSLGSGKGITQPISIGRSTGRSGIGSGATIPPVKETSVDDFRTRTVNIQKQRDLANDIRKGRRIVSEMDEDVGISRLEMWTVEEGEEDLFLVGKSGEEVLSIVDARLRNEYFYCMYW